MKELFFRTITGILIVLLVAGSILLGPITFSAIVLMIYLLGVRELVQLYRKVSAPFKWIRMLPGAILIILGYMILNHNLSMLWLLLPLVLWLATIPMWGFTIPATLGFLWLALPLTAFLALGWASGSNGYNYQVPLAIIALVWINDIFAYLSGSLLGKHKMTPVISPGKSWEGFIGGLLFSILGGWIAWKFSAIFSIWTWLIFSLVISTLGLAGDLFESGLKRSLKVKNSGTMLPGHGGILDRFDSLLFVAPAILIVIILTRLLS